MNPEETAGYVMKRLMEKGADDVIVSSQEKAAQLIKFSNSKINTTKTWELHNLSVFVAKDKKLVATNIRDTTLESSDQIVARLLEFIRTAPKNEEYQGIAKGPFKYKPLQQGYDKRVESMEDKSIDYVQEAVNLAQEAGVERSAGTLQTGVDNTYLLTSGGVEAREQASRIYFSIRCFAKKDASGHMVTAARTLDGFGVKETVEHAADIAVKSVNPTSCESGTYDVLFDHMPYANILGTVGSAVSIFSVEAGLSFLTGKLNQKVANDKITLIDDATMPNGYNSSIFDAEGVPCQKNTLIQDGVLKTFLHNTSTARRYKTKTTASAGLISPTTYNMILKPGTMGKDEMISSIKKGIYITNVWYTRFQNYMTGDFSTIPRDGAFLIENGKITRPVKDIRVSDNVLRILQSTTQLGKESRQIVCWEVDTPIETPLALVQGVSITRSER